MGEAKRRQANDILFGSYPKVGKGIILSVPVVAAAGGALSIRGSTLDESELRRAILYWDRLVWPDSRLVSFGETAESEYLQGMGVLERPILPSLDGDIAINFAKTHFAAFSERDKSEPGLWAMSEGPDGFSWDSGVDHSRGTLVTLYRTIPVPDRAIPLEDLLNFKEKRRDEIRALTLEIDNIYTCVNNSSDSEFEFNRAIAAIDEKCSTMLKVASEANFAFRLSDLKVSFSASLGSVFSVPAFAALGELVGSGLGLPQVGKFLGGAASFISLGSDATLAKSLSPNSPYRFVSNLHGDVI